MSDTTETCPRCEMSHGTCHHTAAPIEVGDTIGAGMSVGRWARAMELRPNSRVKDAEGSEWVKTRMRDGAWERVKAASGRTGTGRPIWDLHMIVDEQQGYGPLTVLHVAGRRAAR